MNQFNLPTFLRSILGVGLLWGLLANPLSAATLGENLIINGNAEQGGCDSVGNAIGTDIPAIPGWTPTANFSVLCYGATGFSFVNMFGQIVQVSGLPDANTPAPSNRGSNFFYGGGDRASSSATQTITVTNLAPLIDAGQASFQLTGWMGGYSSDGDEALLNLNFLNAGGQVLGTASIVTPTPSQRNNQTGLFAQGVNGLVPLGTRQIDVQLNMNYVRGRVNDGYADNLSLVITGIPEPTLSPLIMLLLGIVGWKLRQNS